MCSSWEVDDLWLDKIKLSDGYILLEALISMSVLVFLLAGTMPYFIGLFEVRHIAKSDVEISRFLYESSLFWNGEVEDYYVTSGGIKARVYESVDKIVIKGEGENEAEVKILSIIWDE